MKEKKFRQFIGGLKDLVKDKGACISSDKITVDGMIVGYMYREEPVNDVDSGWRFFAGTEDDEYINNPENLMFYDINTIANYDFAIIPYLDFEIGCEFFRNDDDTFRLIESGE